MTEEEIAIVGCISLVVLWDINDPVEKTKAIIGGLQGMKESDMQINNWLFANGIDTEAATLISIINGDTALDEE